MDSCTIRRTPAGLLLESNNGFYLISDKDILLFKRGYTVPLRDQDRKSHGPMGMVYNRNVNTEVRIPGGEVLVTPSRVLSSSDHFRRVIIPSSYQAVPA